MAAGYTHSLALKSDGTVVAWGWNSGPGETNVPPGLTAVIAIAAGELWSLALLQDGTLRAWGQGSTCGDGPCPTPPSCPCFTCGGTPHPGYNPTLVPAPDPGQAFVAISATGHYGLAKQTNGLLKAWGANEQCQVSHLFTGVVSKFSAGHKHGLVLNANGQYCTGIPQNGTSCGWGNNGFGQVSRQTVTTLCQGLQPCPGSCACFASGACEGSCYYEPPNPFSTILHDIKGGYHHTTIQLPNRTLRAWGKDFDEQSSGTPTGITIFAFSASYDHGIGIVDELDSGYVNCDGSNDVDVNDLACFMSRFAQGDWYGDCDGNSELNALDLACFITKYQQASQP
ncbi:MAG: RCC1 domain-containing protein [Phycisphaerales bacterium]